MADDQPIILTELGGAERVLELADASLPQRGVTTEGETRLKKTHYPGSATASTQVLGTHDNDIVMTGILRDTWIGLEGGALALATELRSMWLGQTYMQLEWGDTLVVRGFISKIRVTHFYRGWLGYDLTFSVAESDEAEVIVSEFEPIEQSTSLWQQILQVLEDAQEVFQAAGQVNNVARALF